VQTQRGTVLADDHALAHAPHRPAGGLKDDAGRAQDVHEVPGGTVQAGRLRGVDLQVTVVNAQAGQGGQDVLDEAQLDGRVAQGSAALRPGDELDPGRHVGGWGEVGADKDDAGGHRRGPEAEPHLGPGQVAYALDLDGPGESPLVAVAEPSHV